MWGKELWIFHVFKYFFLMRWNARIHLKFFFFWSVWNGSFLNEKRVNSQVQDRLKESLGVQKCIWKWCKHPTNYIKAEIQCKHEFLCKVNNMSYRVCKNKCSAAFSSDSMARVIPLQNVTNIYKNVLEPR